MLTVADASGRLNTLCSVTLVTPEPPLTASLPPSIAIRKYSRPPPESGSRVGLLACADCEADGTQWQRFAASLRAGVSGTSAPKAALLEGPPPWPPHGVWLLPPVLGQVVSPSSKLQLLVADGGADALVTSATVAGVKRRAPDAPAPAAGAGIVLVHTDARLSLARPSKRSRASDDTGRDTPVLALIRQEWISWHHRRFAAAFAVHWPALVRGTAAATSKMLRACASDGLLPGLQAAHARLLLALQLQQKPDDAVDPLLPSVPAGVERDTAKEMTACGMEVTAATTIATDMPALLLQAARSVALAKETLLRGSGVCSDTGAASTLLGALHLVGIRDAADGTAARGEPRIAVVFTPTPEAAATWLAPVAATDPVPPSTAEAAFGSLNKPLYGGLSSISSALAASGVPTTPFTCALLLTPQHFRKLALFYVLRRAGVDEPAHLAATDADDLHELAALALVCDRDVVSSGVGAAHVRPSTAAIAVADQPAHVRDFAEAVFCVLARYETFAGNAGGLQGAVPHNVFDALESAWGVHCECFASPLNAHFPSFHSAFPDTDCDFGSRGDFFAAPLLEGAYEANPPFVNSAMLRMAQRMGTVLQEAASAGRPLLFFVIVPSWDDAYFHKLLASSPHLCHSARLPRKRHEFIDGLQHRAGRCTWAANVDSSIFLLATAAAVAAYGVSEASWSDVLKAAGEPTMSVGASSTSLSSAAASAAATPGTALPMRGAGEPQLLRVCKWPVVGWGDR